MTAYDDSSSLETLFDKYQLSYEQREIFRSIKGLKNMPDDFYKLDNEEIIWSLGVETVNLMVEQSQKPTSSSDMKFYTNKVQERLRRFVELAEKQYGWYTLKWTKPTMKRLIEQWFCGMLVIDPNLVSKNNGQPITWTHEYYGDDSGYPTKENQTDEWKKESIDLYVLMVRSICKSYPASTTKGIVTFSDMKDFDWDKYDMGTKERNANIGSVIPNKLVRMIVFHPDEKMESFYNDMTPSSRKKFGFEQYLTFDLAIEGESNILPTSIDMIPTFVGGTYKVDILDCLKYLFRYEPGALELLMETYTEMEKCNTIPKPRHME